MKTESILYIHALLKANVAQKQAAVTEAEKAPASVDTAVKLHECHVHLDRALRVFQDFMGKEW